MNYLLTSLLLSSVLTCRGYVDPKIVGGEDARVGQYPYQVSLRYNSRHFCGGSIINRRYVLTAGHCVVGIRLTEVDVHVGTNRLSQSGDKYEAVSMVSLAYRDTKGIMQNDVALIAVATDFRFNERVQPVKLANFEVNEGATAVASGWGRLSDEGNQLPDVMQHINLTVISNQKCKFYYRSVQTSNICTLTRRGQGVCKGDSGSPLVMNGVQIGIVSYGTTCASGFPDVYARVSNFTDWIGANSNWTPGTGSPTPPGRPGGDEGGNGPAGLPLPSVFLVFLLALAHSFK